MRALFPGGIEEMRDARGRLEVAVYASPPLTLPADLGPWRIEPVEDMRARVWREDHHGMLIGGRLWVGPPSEHPQEGALAVVIEQGHAFGSGAHATTTGCLELLCDLDDTGSVLDLGCGSGVLSIAAVRLGHTPVYACDVDPLAVSAARENVRVNDVDVEVFEADAASDELPTADLWLANLAKGPLTDVLARPDAPEAGDPLGTVRRRPAAHARLAHRARGRACRLARAARRARLTPSRRRPAPRPRACRRADPRGRGSRHRTPSRSSRW